MSVPVTPAVVQRGLEVDSRGRTWSAIACPGCLRTKFLSPVLDKGMAGVTWSVGKNKVFHLDRVRCAYCGERSVPAGMWSDDEGRHFGAEMPDGSLEVVVLATQEERRAES